MPVNYLRLFRASIQLFRAVEAEGSVEPIDTPDLLATHNRLMQALFFRNRSYSENVQVLTEIAKSENLKYALKLAAEGTIEFIMPVIKRSRALHKIGSALSRIWIALDEPEQEAIRDIAEESLALWHALRPVNKVIEAHKKRGLITFTISDSDPSNEPSEKEVNDRRVRLISGSLRNNWEALLEIEWVDVTPEFPRNLENSL